MKKENEHLATVLVNTAWFKDWVQGISNVITEGTLQITPAGLTVTVVGLHHVCLVHTHIAAADCEAFACVQAASIVLNWADVVKYSKQIKPSKKDPCNLMIEIIVGTQQIMFGGFTLYTIDSTNIDDLDEIVLKGMHKLQHSASVKVALDTWKMNIHMLAAYSEVGEFWYNDMFFCSCLTSKGGYTNCIGKSTSITTPRSMYAVGLLQKIATNIKQPYMLEVFIGTAVPIRLRLQYAENSYLEVWIAPRVEEEEDDDE